MANIFSGLFSNRGGGASAKLAKYKFQLEQHELDLEKERQRKATQGSSTALQTMIGNFGPERQDMANYFRSQLNYPASYDQGELGISKMGSQYGAQLQTSKAEEEDLQAKKDFHDYKKANPATPERQLYDMWYASLPRTPEEAGEGKPSQEAVLERARKEQLVDTGAGFQSARRRDFYIRKETELAAFRKELGDTRSDMYFSFNDTLNSVDVIMSHMLNKRGDVQQLHGMTRDNTTGWYAMGQMMPGTEQLKWNKLKGTVIANIGIDKLLEMKENSPSGASGMGALSDTEMAILVTIAGNLDQTNDPVEIKKNLRRLDVFYSKMIRTRKQTLSTIHRKNIAAEKANFISKEFRNVIPESQKYLLNIPGAEMPVEETPLPDPTETSGDVFLDAESYLQENQ